MTESCDGCDECVDGDQLRRVYEKEGNNASHGSQIKYCSNNETLSFTIFTNSKNMDQLTMFRGEEIKVTINNLY